MSFNRTLSLFSHTLNLMEIEIDTKELLMTDQNGTEELESIGRIGV